MILLRHREWIEIRWRHSGDGRVGGTSSKQMEQLMQNLSWRSYKGRPVLVLWRWSAVIGQTSHPSTNQAWPCLASEIRRDRARSGWYGRRLVGQTWVVCPTNEGVRKGAHAPKENWEALPGDRDFWAGKTKIYPVQIFFFRPWHLQTEVCNLISITLLMSEFRFVLHDSNFYYQIIIGHFFWVLAEHTEMDFWRYIRLQETKPN